MNRTFRKKNSAKYHVFAVITFSSVKYMKSFSGIQLNSYQENVSTISENHIMNSWLE